MYCFCLAPIFFLVYFRCNQTAVHGSPPCHAATASLPPAPPARVKWQPGYRTRKKWTGVQKVSSRSGWAVSISQQQKRRRWIVSAAPFISSTSLMPRLLSFLFLFSYTRSFFPWLGLLTCEFCIFTSTESFILTLTSTLFSLLTSSHYHFPSVFLSLLVPEPWGNHGRSAAPGVPFTLTPWLAAPSLHRTYALPSLPQIAKLYCILCLQLPVRGVPLWISYEILWTNTWFPHSAISEPLSLQKPSPSV